MRAVVIRRTPTPSSPGDIGGDEPDCPQAVPVSVMRTYTLRPVHERDGLDLLLAVVGPHDPDNDWHRLVERVPGLAGARIVGRF
jgi:hypothetical protein